MTQKQECWIHDHFPFIRIPKSLLCVDNFPNLSPEAILLYGAMMDRTSLSVRFGEKRFISPSNEITIIFTQREIMKILRCKRDKARSITQELVKSNLIVLKRKKNRGPYIITVIPQKWDHLDAKKEKIDTLPLAAMSEKPSYHDEKNNISIGDNIGLNNTDINNTDLNKFGEKITYVFLDESNYKKLLANYNPTHVDRILEVLQGLFSCFPETIYLHGKEMNWCTIKPLFESLTLEDFQFVLQKMNKAKYTEEYSDAFILDALYSAIVFHS